MLSSKVSTIDNMQLISMYESLSMSPEEIAADLNYPVEGVKLVLLGGSDKYREHIKESTNSSEGCPGQQLQEDSSLFSRADATMAASTIVELSRSAEVEGVRMRACEFIINEHKGRNDVVALGAQNFSITLINQTMARARERMKMAKGGDKDNILELKQAS